MNLKNDLTLPEADRLRALCNFTDDERTVFDMRIRGKGVVEISLACSMSTATVNRRLAGIRRKVARVIQN